MTLQLDLNCIKYLITNLMVNVIDITQSNLFVIITLGSSKLHTSSIYANTLSKSFLHVIYMRIVGKNFKIITKELRFAFWCSLRNKHSIQRSTVVVVAKIRAQSHCANVSSVTSGLRWLSHTRRAVHHAVTLQPYCIEMIEMKLSFLSIHIPWISNWISLICTISIKINWYILLYHIILYNII